MEPPVLFPPDNPPPQPCATPTEPIGDDGPLPDPEPEEGEPA